MTQFEKTYFEADELQTIRYGVSFYNDLVYLIDNKKISEMDGIKIIESLVDNDEIRDFLSSELRECILYFAEENKITDRFFDLLREIAEKRFCVSDAFFKSEIQSIIHDLLDNKVDVEGAIRRVKCIGGQMMNYVPSKYNIMCEDVNGDLLISNLIYRSHKRVPSEHKKYVEEILKTGTNNLDLIVKKLRENGFLVDEAKDERRLLELYRQEYLFRQSEILYLMIVPTQLCNFRCVYCWQDDRKGVMSKNTINGVKKFIDKKSRNCKKIVIEWFGGEPLLEYDTIVEIMKYVDDIRKKRNIPYVSIITTNGSLINSERMRELLKYRVFSYQITVDGIKETHNQTRPHKDPSISSYDLIIKNLKDIRDNVKERLFEIIIRVNLSTVVEEKLDDFLEIYSQEFGDDKRFTLHLEKVEDKGGKRISENSSIIINDDMRAISDMSRAIQAKNHMHMFGELHIGMFACKVIEQNSFNINYNGDLFMCEMALDNNDLKDINTIGSIDEDGNCTIDEEKVAWWRIPRYNAECGDCNISPLCLGGVCPLSSNLMNRCNLHHKPYLMTNTMQVYANNGFYSDLLNEGEKNDRN